MSVRELIFPVAQIIQKRGIPRETWDFLATLYSAQEKIGTEELWNREFIDGLAAVSNSSYVQNVIAKKIHSFPKRYQDVWDEYQIMMNDIYGMLDPIPLAQAEDAATLALYFQRAGVFEQDPGGGGPYTTDLVASDMSTLASGLATPDQYADAWNSLLVDYEATLGNTVQYITPLLGANGANFYRMSTIENTLRDGLFYT